MIRQSTAILFVLSFALSSAYGSSEYEITTDSIYNHIAVLAHDSLEGREIGEVGEWKAAQYISSVFEAAGLTPKGTDGFLQSVGFIKRIDFGPKNKLVVNGIELTLNEEFIPMKQSASTQFEFGSPALAGYGITVDSAEGEYDDYENVDVAGKAVVIKRYSPPVEEYPHTNFERHQSLTAKINRAIKNKAAGILFVTPEGHDDTLTGMQPVRVTAKDIPIIFLRRKGLERLGLDISAPEITSLTGEIELVQTRDTGYNVVALAPAENDTTIIIGAHYDHLGWGGRASLYKGEEPMVHNGADDNASGVAGMLELARYYQSRRDQMKYSILFCAFSGEEAGLIGSSHFSKNMTIDSTKARMMINMDMIGRLRDQEKDLAVFGTGTCEPFTAYFDSLQTDDLTIAAKEPGTGPSDMLAFYNRGIPVLFFFTGAHSDYHKPSDDVELIDLDGSLRVISFVSDVVGYFDGYDGDLVFQKTKDPEAGKRRAQFSVTLGIIPDYVAEVKGLRVDGISSGRPGEAAGLIEGDVIIQMGDIPVGDIYDYMGCLGSFRLGDTTMIRVERGADTVSLQVIFQ
jgi:hypothetical protein